MKKMHDGGIGNMRNLLLAVLLLGALAQTAIATPYYVALPPAGNDDGTHDGLSWAEPLATISNALAKATTANDEIIVSNGTYTVTATLLVTNAITLRSANNDREATIVDGTNGVRCIQVSNNLAVVRGFTFYRGRHTTTQAGGIRLDAGTVDNCVVRQCSPTGGNAWGGGVWIAGADGNTAVITNSLITLNTCGGSGAGIYSAVNKSALITHTTISSNTVTANQGGGGIYILNSAGTLLNCVIEGNKTTGDWNYGAGYVSGGVLRNCLIINNSAPIYGGLYMTGGTNENCTIVGNINEGTTTASGLHVNNTFVRNAIIHGNLGAGPQFWAEGTRRITNSLVNPQETGVVSGTIGGDPRFVNPAAGDYRIRPDSPAYDTGTNLAWMSTATDLAGNARKSPADGIVDMGAYEWPQGVLACAPAASVVNGTAPLSVVLTAQVTGPDLAGLYYRWSFTNSTVVDVEGADKAVVTNTYGIGTWTVTLAVSNAAGQTASSTLTNAIKVGAMNAYVATNGPHVWPYTNWTMAASNIQHAVNVGALGSTVWVSNGLYLLTGTISVNDGIAVKAANGLGTVTVHGQTNVRCFVVNHTNAALEGLDIRRGRANYGAGVFLVAGLVDNCLITTNFGSPISVLYQGVLRNSSIVSNQSGFLGNNGISGVGSISFVKGSGQVDGGLVENCVIADNAVSHNGPLHMTRATIRNTLIAGNRATAEGGDASGNKYIGARFLGCIVENCTITSNTVTTVGANIAGVYADANARFYNTIIHGNRTSTGAIAPTNYYFAGSPQVYHSLLEPAYPSAVASLSGDPLLNPDFTLSAGSPCINQGTNLAWMTTTQTNDLAGNARIQGAKPDMGAYEFEVSSLACSFTASVAYAFVDVPVAFTATVSGENTDNIYYRWAFTNVAVVDLEGYGLGSVTTNFPAGSFTPTLAVSNTSGTASFTLGTALKVGPAIVYVANAGANSHTFPYASWPTAASNVQAAVNAGIRGTLVLVTNGTYALSAQIVNSEGMTIRSVNGPAVTTLQGGSNIRSYYSTHADAVLDGFTLRSGLNVGGGGGGAHLLAGALLNCVITNNTSATSSSGGGVYLAGVNTLVSNCVIAGNSAVNDLGGGLFANAGGVMIVDCVFSNNTSGSTGGAYLTAGGTVRNCLFVNNSSGSSTYRFGAGGLYIAGAGSTVENCTIAGNATTHTNSAGGLQAAANVVFYNTIVWGNTSTNANPNWLGGQAAYHCNLDPAWSGTGSGNISADPLFAGGGDYGLLPASWCIEAGTNLAWASESGALDLAGNPRKQGKFVDIGAYEAPWSPPGTVFSIR